MDRIYHRYELWEDWPAGLYNSAGRNKSELIDKVIELFSDPKLTRKFMLEVIEKWPYSCEHNLTNNSLNKIAYLGQAACCLYAKIPATVTMEAWSKVPEKFRNEANEIAAEVLSIWEAKQHQLCLKFH